MKNQPATIRRARVSPPGPASISTRALAAVVVVTALVPPTVWATPYASSLTNDAGTISFRLNEPADNVKVIWNSGATTNDLGALDAGLHTFALGVTGSFSVRVNRVGATPWSLISNDTNRLLQFNSPRGVAVNTNPASPAFGRIYVANSSAGTTGTGRPVGDGLYLLNADQSDAVSRGDTAATGGIGFTSGAQQSGTPWRLEVGPDDHLYIGDFSTNTGTIYRTDPEVSDGSGINVLEGIGITNDAVHTTIGSSTIVGGTLANGALTVWATDGRFPGGGNFNRLFRWDIGAGPLPFNGPPTPLAAPVITSVAEVTTDVDRGPDGKFYLMQNRSAGNESGLFVVDAEGLSVLWASLAESRTISNNPAAVDILRISRAVKVSPDGQRIALIRDDLQTWVIPLTNGIPDLSLRELVQTYSGPPTTLGRDVCWDAAGNLYALSSGNQLLSIFSPGGTTVAITGSDGSFEVIRPPGVSVVATDPVASETGTDPAVFSIYREGDASRPLTVEFTLSGAASNGIDYVTNTLSATIPAGATNVDVVITPLDDPEAELTESVLLNLLGGVNYDLKPPITAQADLVDNEMPNVINLSPVRTNAYEGTPTAPLVFQLERRGDTNIELFGIVFESSGAATAAIDYEDLVALFLPAGLVTTNLSLAPLGDEIYEGDESVGLTVVAGTEPYLPGNSPTFRGVIRDDDFPPAAELYADDFEVDSSSGYQLRFGANDGVGDYTANFSFDYSTLGISPAPHSVGGTSRGLYLQVNKNDATGSAAGVNVYPLFDSFSGNYAVRCDMFLNFGTSATTEHAQIGLNHSGLLTNRVTQSADANNTTAGGDGIWVGIVTDGSGLRDYTAYTYPTPGVLPQSITNRTAASLADVITAPPYAFPGSPANSTANPKTWAELQMSQFNGMIRLEVNGLLIYEFPNTTPFSNGVFMLGMNDQYSSVGSAQNFVVFDNLRVVRLEYEITNLRLAGNQVEIDFVSSFGARPDEFRLQISTALPGNWSDDPDAVIVPTADGFRATTVANGEGRFYRLVR